MSKFNVRVYGVYLQEQKVLLSLEHFRGKTVLKFPGGGLEFGEGLIECLRREWQEELNCTLKVGEHFYTTDYYQPSAWDDTQVISIYYIVHPEVALRFPLNNGNELFDWYPVNQNLQNLLTLPIDKVVGKLLLKKVNG